MPPDRRPSPGLVLDVAGAIGCFVAAVDLWERGRYIWSALVLWLPAGVWWRVQRAMPAWWPTRGRTPRSSQ
jgi:hypothetical protein